MTETKHHEPIVYRIYDELKNHIGKKNAISGKDLSEMFNISDRVLRGYINKIAGCSELTRTVGTSNKGYYICSNNKEFNQANGRIWKQALSLIKRAKAQEKKAQADGQFQIQLGKYYKEFIQAFGE